MNKLSLVTKKRIYYSFAVLVLIYIILKSFSKAGDFVVYLYASEQLFKGENIYKNNPFNNYLYSPLFALLLKPILVFGFPIARVIWALINVVVTVRIWKLILCIAEETLSLKKNTVFYWTLGVIIISAGFWNHNLILGQMTMFILWLTFEGLYQIINRGKNFLGGFLLGLGIVIKIVPMLALFYLFFKLKFRAIAITLGFILVGLLLPSLFVGHNYNMDLLGKWGETINPSNKKYVFEDSNGTVSLNATLPAYFYEFENSRNKHPQLERQIATISHDTLLVVLQGLRLATVLSLLLLVFYNYKKRAVNKGSLYFLWEVSYLALISILIFPHQQKYVLMYFVPAASYMILFSLLLFNSKKDFGLKYKVIAIVSSVLMFIAAIMGRDIVGKAVMKIYDFYHIPGLMVILFLVFLFFVKPDFLMKINNQENE